MEFANFIKINSKTLVSILSGRIEDYIIIDIWLKKTLKVKIQGFMDETDFFFWHPTL
jgi:hypothetical protein